MHLHIGRLGAGELDVAAAFFEKFGYLRLTGLKERVTPMFLSAFAGALGVSEAEIGPWLDPASPPASLSNEMRRRLARVEPSPAMQRELLVAFEPILARLLGSFVHFNSTFHCQLKGGAAPAVDHGGYGDAHAEVQGPYLLHQDFAGARLPTSPSALTLWVGLNDCDHWTLRIYPGSHRRGLLTDRWLELDDERLASLGTPVDIASRAGEGVLFHALTLHGSSNWGPSRRVSCDSRFFPLSPFLPSRVHALGDRPLRAHRENLLRAPGDVVRAPFLEALAVLGERHARADAIGPGVVHWLGAIEGLLDGDRGLADAALERFAANGFEPDPTVAYARFLDAPLQIELIEALRVKSTRGAPR